MDFDKLKHIEVYTPFKGVYIISCAKTKTYLATVSKNIVVYSHITIINTEQRKEIQSIVDEYKQ